MGIAGIWNSGWILSFDTCPGSGAEGVSEAFWLLLFELFIAGLVRPRIGPLADPAPVGSLDADTVSPLSAL